MALVSVSVRRVLKERWIKLLDLSIKNSRLMAMNKLFFNSLIASVIVRKPAPIIKAVLCDCIKTIEFHFNFMS